MRRAAVVVLLSLCGAACLAAEAPDIQAPAAPAASARIELGRRLFYDADLSIDGTMSCGTCHEQHRAFTDGNAAHPGVSGEPGRRNVPGLANVGSFRALTWADPSLTRLEAQVFVPLQGRRPVEMGMAGKDQVLSERLGADPCYRRMFADAFAGDATITVPKIAQAIATFERTLVSDDAPLDRYRRGDLAALSPREKQGEALFYGSRLGCASCHAGDNFTDGQYHDIGLGPRDGTGADHGLSEVTFRAADDGRFRTPSLRNAALTAPYLHDGRAATLADAIRAHFAPDGAASRDAALAGRSIDDSDLQAVIAFLDALTDQQFVHDPRFSLPKTACGKPL